MTYDLVFSEQAKKQLNKMDKKVAALIVGWLKKNILNTTNPRQFGKSLTGNHKGEWRYRVGNYRIISEIIDNQVIVLVVSIGHRKDIY